MPVKASYWDAWYEACKDDYFAWGDGGYWDLPTYATAAYKGAGAAGTNTAYTSCTKLSNTYKSGKEVAEDMWGGAFTYETDEANAYVMTFTDGQPNPNNALFTDKAYPRECAGHEVNITHPGFDTDGKTRRSYSDLACPVDWHKESSAGVSERSSRDTLTCDTAANAAYTKVVSGSECKGYNYILVPGLLRERPRRPRDRMLRHGIHLHPRRRHRNVRRLEHPEALLVQHRRRRSHRRWQQRRLR